MTHGHAQHNRDNQSIQKINTSNLLVMLLFVIVVAIGGAQFYLYDKYLGLQTDSTAKSDATDKLKQLLELNSANITKMEGEVKVTSDQLLVVQNILNNIDKVNQNPTLYIKLLNVENIINAADFKLRIDKDIVSTRKLLGSAQQFLINSTQTDLITLRKNILKKIQQLEELNYPDEIKFFANLEELARRIDQLTAIELMVNYKENNNQTVINSSNSSVINTQKKEWPQALDAFKNDLLSLVKIKRFDPNGNNITQLLSDEQLLSLKLLLKLNIEQAIIDLKLKEFSRFNSDIDKIIVNINTYFKNNEVLKNSALQLIEPLQDIKYPDNIPDLSDLQVGAVEKSE